MTASQKTIEQRRRRNGPLAPSQDATKIVRKTPSEDKFRLPDGAKVEAVYHAESQIWTVTLAVAGEIVAATCKTSLHTAIIVVGQMWKKTLADKPQQV